MPAAMIPSPRAAARPPARAVQACPARSRPRLRRALSAALIALGLQQPARALEEVPYVQTPQPVVDAILDLAAVGPGDRLVDLGSGDGRIVITAARRFGTRGLGVEIDPNLVEAARRRAAAAGVADRARFVTQDLFETDLSGATVVTLYLLPDVNLALRPRLLDTLAAGTRIVSHDWDMGDWRPDRSVTVPAPNKPVGLRQQSTLHLWVVPAKVSGAWQLRIGPAAGDGRAGADSRGDTSTGGRDRAGSGLRLAIGQQFQHLTVTAADADTPGSGTGPGTGSASGSGPGSGRVDGRAVSFELRLAGRTLRFEGLAEGSRMAGTVAGDAAPRAWEASRAPPGTATGRAQD